MPIQEAKQKLRGRLAGGGDIFFRNCLLERLRRQQIVREGASCEEGEVIPGQGKVICKGPVAEKRKQWNYKIKSKAEQGDDVRGRLCEVMWSTANV